MLKLLNSVMYNDNYMFIAIHICLMLKINEGQKKQYGGETMKKLKKCMRK